MNITVFGSGYVGLVAAACFAEVGHQVVCVDVNAEKVRVLREGKCPIYEPGLEPLLQSGLRSGHLQFTTDLAAGVKHGKCQFIAVGTPPDVQGNADLRYVFNVAETIATHMQDYTVVIDKSTVPIGTADQVRDKISGILSQRGMQIDFDVVSNPEFLKEGAALADFRHPDRIVLGVSSPRAQAVLTELYAPFNPNQDKLLVMDTRSAELTKYASNAMLATKISFMNEMANIAERVGADIEQVRMGIGADPRIGYHFINAGCGYGGSCFGKDVQALIHTAQKIGCKAEIIAAVEQVNAKQKLRLVEKILHHYRGKINHKVFAVWGLAFKPQTDDMRDAPSIPVIQALTAQGAKIQAFDPEAMQEARKIFNQHAGLFFAQTPEEALEGSDALIVFTEWPIFRSPDFALLHARLRDKAIFDGRNIYDPQQMQQLGIAYYGIGRGLSCEHEMFAG